MKAPKKQQRPWRLGLRAKAKSFRLILTATPRLFRFSLLLNFPKRVLSFKTKSDGCKLSISSTSFQRTRSLESKFMRTIKKLWCIRSMQRIGAGSGFGYSVHCILDGDRFSRYDAMVVVVFLIIIAAFGGLVGFVVTRMLSADEGFAVEFCRSRLAAGGFL
ncbi:hypothetical protein Droror1_Dr00009021 [Drosera rotundifolia]